MSTMTLQANAVFGFEGKQFVARIIGRHSKYTFDREFIGTKRKQCTEATIDGPGLYEIRNIGKHGDANDSYFIYDGERIVEVSKENAMALAKAIANVDWRKEVTIQLISDLKEYIKTSQAKDPEGEVTINKPVGNLPPGTHKRSILIAERQHLLAALQASLDPKADAVARVKALMNELNVSLKDL